MSSTLQPLNPSTSADVVIRVENLYKEYRLGTISHGTLYKDLQSWWARKTVEGLIQMSAIFPVNGLTT